LVFLHGLPSCYRGLTTEVKLAVTDHYTPLLPDFLGAPQLNEEQFAHLPVEAKNREKILKQAQKDLGLALTPLGIALSMVIAENDFPNKLLV